MTARPSKSSGVSVSIAPSARARILPRRRPCGCPACGNVTCPGRNRHRRGEPSMFPVGEAVDQEDGEAPASCRSPRWWAGAQSATGWSQRADLGRWRICGDIGVSATGGAHRCRHVRGSLSPPRADARLRELPDFDVTGPLRFSPPPTRSIAPVRRSMRSRWRPSEPGRWRRRRAATGRRPRLRGHHRRRAKRSTLVAGGDGALEALRDAALVNFVAPGGAPAPGGSPRLSGSALLAAAGLLDGKRATTHWARPPGWRAPSQVQVEADAIYVRDGDIWTSGGDHRRNGPGAGSDRARHRARGGAFRRAPPCPYMMRPGGQSQFSAELRMQISGAHRSPRAYIAAHLGGDHAAPRWPPLPACRNASLLRLPTN